MSLHSTLLYLGRQEEIFSERHIVGGAIRDFAIKPFHGIFDLYLHGILAPVNICYVGWLRMLLLVGDRERRPLTSNSIREPPSISSLQAGVPPERVIPQRTRESSFIATNVKCYRYYLVNFKNCDVHILSFNNADYANCVIRLSIPRYDYNRIPLFPTRLCPPLFAPPKKKIQTTKVKKIYAPSI